MKKILCLSLLFVAGCASFSETAAVNMPAQLKTFSIGEFTGSDPALASLFTRTVKDEFEKAGFLVDKEKPDFVLTGIARTELWNFMCDQTWNLSASDLNGNEIATANFQDGVGLVPSGRQSPNVAKELSKRLIGILKGK